MIYRILKVFGIESIKPTPMLISPNDLFQLIEVTVNGITQHEPCELPGIRELIIKYYGDQPLKYFNENKRLKVIHLKTGVVRDATLDVSSF